MNLPKAFKEGQQEKNAGLNMGLSGMNRAINGLQKKKIYVVAGAPKAGKSTFADFCWLLMPYLLNPKAKLHFIYFSFEIDRVEKQFKFIAFFFYWDYKVSSFVHTDGKRYDITPDYLKGLLKDDAGKVILCTPEHTKWVQEIYTNRIIPLFGHFDERGYKVVMDEKGNPLPTGIIDFIEQKDNPTGIRNYIMNYARQRGEFIPEYYYTLDENGNQVQQSRIIGYSPKKEHEDVLTIIFVDHMRKLLPERGFTLKQTVDKCSEYMADFRNWCSYSFVPIIHINREISGVDRMRFAGEFLYPTGDDIKDTGNLSEDCNYLFTIFNANDEKYNIKKHFGLQLVDPVNDAALHPKYRSIHLVDSRDTECPKHIRTNMFGNINLFEDLKVETNG